MFVIPGYQSIYKKTTYQNFGNAGYLYQQQYSHYFIVG
jgi:hypothetical protein